MFLVFNKQKIYSYVVALSTVVALFIIVATITNKSEEIIQMMSQAKLLPIYSVETEEPKMIKMEFKKSIIWIRMK